MKKKYYILALTFLCMLVGQSNYGQTSGGDYAWEIDLGGLCVGAGCPDNDGGYTDTGDPCDPFSMMYSSAMCNMGDGGSYDSGDPCDPTSLSYDAIQCAGDSGDPCDPSSLAYNPSDCNNYGGVNTPNAYGFSFGDLLLYTKGNNYGSVRNGISTASTVVGLGTALPSTVLSSLAALMEEIGFTSITKIGTTATGLSYVGAMVGTVEFGFAVTDALTGADPWKTSDTLNTMSTALGWASIGLASSGFGAPIAIGTGGLSLLVGFAAAAASSSGN